MLFEDDGGRLLAHLSGWIMLSFWAVLSALLIAMAHRPHNPHKK